MASFLTDSDARKIEEIISNIREKEWDIGFPIRVRITSSSIIKDYEQEELGKTYGDDLVSKLKANQNITYALIEFDVWTTPDASEWLENPEFIIRSKQYIVANIAYFSGKEIIEEPALLAFHTIETEKIPINGISLTYHEFCKFFSEIRDLVEINADLLQLEKPDDISYPLSLVYDSGLALQDEISAKREKKYQASLFKLDEDDLFAVQEAKDIALSFLRSPKTTDEQRAGLANALYSLDRLPNSVKDIECQFGVLYESEVDSSGHKEMNYIDIFISHDLFNISVGGGVYHSTTGWDSVTEPGWYIERGGAKEQECDLFTLHSRLNQLLKLGAEITVEDKSTKSPYF